MTDIRCMIEKSQKNQLSSEKNDRVYNSVEYHKFVIVH